MSDTDGDQERLVAFLIVKAATLIAVVVYFFFILEA